jgi:hypothetical protein
MPIPGKLELTIKINEFPADAQTVENGWKQFSVETDAGIVVALAKDHQFCRSRGQGED